MNFAEGGEVEDDGKVRGEDRQVVNFLQRMGGRQSPTKNGDKSYAAITKGKCHAVARGSATKVGQFLKAPCDQTELPNTFR